MDKIGALLSDPESLQQLQELAQMLQQEINGDAGHTDAPSAAETNVKSETVKENGSGLDMQMLWKAQELIGAMQRSDADTQLLLALRPHLKEKRQKKVDQAVKLLKLYAIFVTAKENGMLQDLI